jgi:glycosyltransferase involved in cell wall biosynthesis
VKILILNSIGVSKWGGGEKWMVMAASGLTKLGHDVFIGCKKGSVIEQKANDRGVNIVHIDIGSDLSITGAIDLYRLGKKQQFDVVIGCQNKDVRNVGLFKKFLGSPLVISRQGVKLIHRSWKHKWTYTTFCDGIITNTQSIKDEYDSYGWWDSSFVKVIFNGVEESSGNEAFNFSTFLPQSIKEPKVILSAGRLSHQKGFEYLIEAASIVCSQRSDVFFFVAGKGKEEKSLRAMIELRNLKDRFFMIGFHANLEPLFKGSDTFVLSSLYEGMPNVVMEAMINQVPVVATKVNGVNELFSIANIGYLVPPSDAQSLATAIIECVDSPTKTMVDNAYQQVLTNFSAHKMVENLENYLLELISKR